MATIDEEILYDKENKLGLTTFTFRSQRYSIPSVIVKSDTKSEGVCVMLDVGLFCPYCSGGGSTNTKYTHKRCRLSIGKKLIKSQMEQQKLDTLQEKLKMIKSDESSVTESHHQPSDSKMPSDYPAMSEHIVYGDALQVNTECFISESPSKKSRLIDKTHLAKPDLSALDIIAKKTHSDMDQKPSVLPKTQPALVYTGETITSSLDTQIHSCVKSKIGEVQQQSPLKSLVVTAPQMHPCMKPQTVSTQQKQSTVTTGFPYRDQIGHTSHTRPNKGKPYEKGKKVKPKVPPKPGRLATKEKQLSIPALKDLASDVVTGAHFYPFEDSDNSPEILQEFTSSKEVVEFENTLLTQKEDKKSIDSQIVEVETGLMAHNNANKSNLLNGGQEKLVDYENNHNISTPTLEDQSNLVRKQDHFKHKWDNNTKCMKHNNPGHTKSISIENIESSEKSVKIASGDRVTNLCGKTPSVIQHRPQNDDVYVVNGNQTNLKHDSDQSGNGEIMVDLCLSKDINIKDHSKQKLNYEINMDKQQREKCINQSINKYSVQHQDSDLIGYCVDNNQNSNSCTSYHKSDEKLWSRDEGTDSDTSSLYKKSAENLLVSHSFDTGSDTYLMDELLTDSVISEDPDFKDVDENTLIAIERKLMQDLAGLETQESKNREKVSVEDVKNSQEVHLTAFNKDNVNTLENKNNVKLSSENDLNSDNKLKEMDLHDSNNEIGLKEKGYSVTQVKNTVKALERNNNNNIEPSVDMKVTTATSVKTDNIINGVNSKNSDIQNGNHGKRSEKLVKKLPPPVPKKRSMKFEPIENVSVSSKRSEMDRQGERRRKNHDDGSRPRDRCRSASPEIMMEEILDHLDDTETETFSGDATLGRVFSVRREKKYLTLGSLNESQRNSGTSPLQDASGDIGEFYEFMKEMQNAEVEKVTSPDKPKEHKEGRKKIFTVGETGESTEKLCEVNVKISASPNDEEKFGSLNDLLDEEISCAKELNETFSVTDTHHESVTEVHQSLSSDHGKELDQTTTTIGDDSVYSSTLNADEMFENAFENALEDIVDEEQLKEWTSDYESDVKGSNNTSNSASLDRNTSEDNEANQIYQQYLKSLESPTKFKKKPSSSIECNVGDRSQSVLSEVASTENQTPSRESYSRGSLSSGCSYTDEEVNVPEISNIPFEQIILDTNRLTKDIIGSDSRKKETIDDNSNISKFVKMDELNIETTHQEMVINQEELFHSPGSICPPKSPNIVQKPHVLLAKTQKIPLISTTNNNVVHSAESAYPEQKESSIESENVYVTQEDIMNPDINKFIEANIQNNQQNLFRRQPSIDEMSEGSTMSSIDEFVPETEEPNAPPEVMQQAYHAAIQVAQMFQHHHVTHPCFQKILEEISSSRESLLISDSEGSRSNTLRRNPLAKKLPIKEETEKENVKDEYFINVEEENKDSEVSLQSSNDQVISENRNDIVVSQGHAQQFLQHVMGSDHKEEEEKQLEGVDKHEECHSCVVKADEGTVVKSEVVSTEEVTLVFAWPKSMGTNFLKANPNLPFRQLHMHRVLKTDDMNVEILEGPSLKSITQKMVPNKAIDQSKTKTLKDSNTAKEGTSDIVATSYSTEENIVSRRNDEKVKEKNDQIIADIDVKVKSTKFTPKGSTVVVERQTKEEGELVESITENIVKVLSQNNTVEYNDQQLSLEHKDSVNQLEALPQPEPDDILNTNCSEDDIRLYSETFFDLVYHETLIELSEDLKLTGNKNSNNTIGSILTVDNGYMSEDYEMNHDKVHSVGSGKISEEIQIAEEQLHEEIVISKHVVVESDILSLKHKVKGDEVRKSIEDSPVKKVTEDQDEDIMSQIALDILENTTGGTLVCNDNISNTNTQFGDRIDHSYAPTAVSAVIINNDNPLHCTNVTTTFANPAPFSPTDQCNINGDSHSQIPRHDFNTQRGGLFDAQNEILDNKNVTSQLLGAEQSIAVERNKNVVVDAKLQEIVSEYTNKPIVQDSTNAEIKINENLNKISYLSKMNSLDSSGGETNDEISCITSSMDLQVLETSNENVGLSSDCDPLPMTSHNLLEQDRPNKKYTVDTAISETVRRRDVCTVTRTVSDTDFDLKLKMENINKELDELFPKKRMYSSLQDLDTAQKVKARSKRLSLSETLLENLENEVRKATSQDEISHIIEGCTFAMEESIRTSAEMIMDVSPEDIKTNPAYRITTELIAANEIPIPHKAKTSSTSTLDTIHEGTTFLKKKQPPPVKAKPQIISPKSTTHGSNSATDSNKDIVDVDTAKINLDKGQVESDTAMGNSDKSKLHLDTSKTDGASIKYDSSIDQDSLDMKAKMELIECIAELSEELDKSLPLKDTSTTEPSPSKLKTRHESKDLIFQTDIHSKSKKDNKIKVINSCSNVSSSQDASEKENGVDKIACEEF